MMERASRSDTAGLHFTVGATALVLATLVGFHFAWTNAGAARFELGSMDRDYLSTPEAFHERVRMNGPMRHPDGRVEVIDFYGRLTNRDATLGLPYHVHQSPVELQIRCHRFGLEGSVRLEVNGELIDELVFAESSYPWGGIRAVIPQSVAERGPLQVRLTTVGGREPGATLPSDIGVGIDWVSLTPMSGAARLEASTIQYLVVAGGLVLALGMMVLIGIDRRLTLSVLAGIAAAEIAGFTFVPFETWMAVRRLWVVFPMAASLFALLARAERRSLLVIDERRLLAIAFAGIVVLHSALIFFPNHAPPDLWNHLPQVSWLQELELDPDEIYRYASSSDPFDDGHVRPHFGVDYGAPYPPFFYVLTYLLSLLHDDTRFLVEFLSVVIAAAMGITLYVLMRAMALGRVSATIALALSVTEIAIWHHAHRVHAPGSLGELVLLLWMVSLALALGRAGTDTPPRRLPIGFALLTTAAALAYAATLVQLGIYVSVLTVVFLLAPAHRRTFTPILTAIGAGLSLAFVLYYAPYALQALQKSSVLLDRAAYDPPASFFLLRNQMRDTVRILQNGYPLYVLISLVGLGVVFRRSMPERWSHRAMLGGAVVTYVLMLILKDPVLFPMIFLHAKEDLFYAPIACLLGAIALSVVWQKGGLGRALVMVVIAGLTALAVRDQIKNHNTLVDQRVARDFRVPSGDIEKASGGDARAIAPVA